MQELEKVLEENGLTREKIIEITVDTEFDMEWNSDIGKSFRKTVIDLLHIAEKKMNGGWIPVEERMPEENEKVDITFREWMEYSKKYRYGRCNAIYIHKHSIKAEDIWSDYENDNCVEYDEKTDTLYAMEGWYETVEHWDDYSHCYINCEVVAWKPLGKPYIQKER